MFGIRKDVLLPLLVAMLASTFVPMYQALGGEDWALAMTASGLVLLYAAHLTAQTIGRWIYHVTGHHVATTIANTRVPTLSLVLVSVLAPYAVAVQLRLLTGGFGGTSTLEIVVVSVSSVVNLALSISIVKAVTNLATDTPRILNLSERILATN